MKTSVMPADIKSNCIIFYALLFLLKYQL